MDLGTAIKECRKAKKISRAAFAQRVGLSSQSVFNIEKNLSFPSKTNMKKICDALDMSVSALMVFALTEEDVPVEKREAFGYLIKPLKEFFKDA